MERFRMTIKVGEHCSTSAVKKNLIDSLIEVRNMGSFVYVIVWALGQIRIDFTCIFKVFPKIAQVTKRRGKFWEKYK